MRSCLVVLLLPIAWCLLPHPDKSQFIFLYSIRCGAISQAFPPFSFFLYTDAGAFPRPGPAGGGDLPGPGRDCTGRTWARAAKTALPAADSPLARRPGPGPPAGLPAAPPGSRPRSPGAPGPAPGCPSAGGPADAPLHGAPPPAKRAPPPPGGPKAEKPPKEARSPEKSKSSSTDHRNSLCRKADKYPLENEKALQRVLIQAIGSVSRVLSQTAIYLVVPLPARSMPPPRRRPGQPYVSSTVLLRIEFTAPDSLQPASELLPHFSTLAPLRRSGISLLHFS